MTSIPTSPVRTEHALVEIRADGSPGGRLVLMDGVEASHVDLGDPMRLEFEYLRHISGLLDAARPPGRPLEALQVGGSPCVLARWLTAARLGARMTVVERDGALADLAHEWLGLRPSPRLRLVGGGGRAEIRRRGDGNLDLVVIDALAPAQRGDPRVATVPPRSEIARSVAPTSVGREDARAWRRGPRSS